MKKTTIKDVAREACVSITTVSHVINKTRYVSDKLKKRVYDAMEQLHYTPNAIAQGLRGGSTKIIGVILPDCTNSFFAEIARAIDHYSFTLGYSVILCNTDNDSERQREYVNMLISKQVDGVLFISANNADTDLKALNDRSIPAVIVDRTIQSVAVDSIIVDNRLGARRAVEHCIQKKRLRIACITGPLELSSAKNRFLGYQEILKEHALPFREDYVINGNFHYSGGVEAFRTLWALDEKPNAVFACNDMMAIGFITTAINNGVRIPEDVSVIGFDNIEMAAITSPPLTTLSQPLTELASTAVEHLLARIEEPEKEIEHIALKPHLVVRDS